MTWARRLPPVLFACLLLAGCETVSEELPTSQTPAVVVVPIPLTSVTPVPANPVPGSTPPPIGTATPTPQPSPSATPTPQATPTPGATPTPKPTPTPLPPSSCAPSSAPPGSDCRLATPLYLGQLDIVLNALLEQEPNLFDKTNKRGDYGYLVLDVARYHNRVVEMLRQRGLCAENFDNEEIGIKVNNNLGEAYDIILSTNHMWRGTGSYMGMCSPSFF